MEVKPKAIESTKKTTKDEDEKMKTKNKDDVIINNAQEITLFKGHLKIFEGLSQANPRHTQSPKTSKPPSSSSSYVMKIKMGNYKSLIQRSEETKKMEQHDDQDDKKNKTKEEETTNIQKMMMMKKKVWDCESTLYDSFELNSFNRQLDSAISSSARSMSMPHLSSSPPPPPPLETKTKKQSSSSSNKISRSLQKLIKSMFRHNNKQSKPNTFSSYKKSSHNGVDMDKYYVVFDKTGSLTTIPESGETTTEVAGGSDSENNSLVRKTVSERFPASRLAGISCS